MKVFLILILSVLFIVSAWAQDYPDSGFTNKAETKNLTVNGLKEGKWVEYFNGLGSVITDTNAAKYYTLTIYKSGIPYGIKRIYFEDGGSRVVHFTDGKVNGLVKEYYKDGKLESEMPIKHDERIGVAKYYYETGKIYFTCPFKNDYINGTLKFYYESGKIMGKQHFINSKQSGLSVMYYENGRIKAEIPYNDGKINGTEKDYSENGKLQTETMYTNGLAGVTKSYDSAGHEIK